MKQNRIYSTLFFIFLIGHQSCSAGSFIAGLGSQALAGLARNGVAAVTVIFVYHHVKRYFQTPLEKRMDELEAYCRGGVKDVNELFETFKSETEALANAHKQILALLKESNNNPLLTKKVEAEQKKADELVERIKKTQKIMIHKEPRRGWCC